MEPSSAQGNVSCAAAAVAPVLMPVVVIVIVILIAATPQKTIKQRYNPTPPSPF